MFLFHTFVSNESGDVSTPASGTVIAAKDDLAEIESADGGINALVSRPHWLIVSSNVNHRLKLQRMLKQNGVLANECGVKEVASIDPLDYRHLVLFDDQSDAIRSQLEAIGVMAGILSFDANESLDVVVEGVRAMPRCC